MSLYIGCFIDIIQWDIKDGALVQFVSNKQ